MPTFRVVAPERDRRRLRPSRGEEERRHVPAGLLRRRGPLVHDRDRRAGRRVVVVGLGFRGHRDARALDGGAAAGEAELEDRFGLGGASLHAEAARVLVGVRARGGSQPEDQPYAVVVRGEEAGPGAAPFAPEPGEAVSAAEAGAVQA